MPNCFLLGFRSCRLIVVNLKLLASSKDKDLPQQSPPGATDGFLQHFVHVKQTHQYL